MTSEQFSHGNAIKSGLLICNLGTPDAPTAKAVKSYLAEFLSDKRVIPIHPLIWWFVLHGFILNTRPKKSAKSYAKVWSNDGSPLLYYSQAQLKAIQNQLDRRLRRTVVTALGMRYGNPSIPSALKILKTAGVQRLLVLPLYPQYSATTTASVFDAISAEFKSWRWLPELRFVNSYYDSPGYIHAIANSIKEHWKAFGKGERLLFSFHGLPQSHFDAGDPYPCMCMKTARKVAQTLGIPELQWQLCYQSRVGNQPWLQPYTDLTLEKLGKEGVKSIDIVCPGFAADCLETLEEIAITNRDIFLNAGGERFHYINALNFRQDHIQALTDVIIKHMQGWPETDPNWNPDEDQAERNLSREIAMGKGAAK